MEEIELNALKRCPFCGRKARTYCVPEQEYRDGEKVVAVYPKVFGICCICKQASVKAATAEKAAEKWNRRAPEWVSVDKVLPPKEMHVLGFDKKRQRNYTNLYFYPDTQEFRDDMYPGKPVSITHWMAYPDAPKEEQGDE